MEHPFRVASLAGALIVGAAAGFLIRSSFPRRDLVPPETLTQIEGLFQERNRLLREMDALRAKARELMERLEALEARRDETEARPAVAREEEAALRPAAALGSSKRAELPYQLASPEEAEAIFQQAIERADFEALWQLGAVLLAMGEPGYEKLITLFEQLEEKLKGNEDSEALIGDPMILGRFIRALTDHHENVLRFGLHLKNKEKDKLPQPIRSLQNMLLRSQERNFFLGFFDGEDPQIREGFLDLIERDLEGDLAAKSEQDLGIAIRGLAQLRVERATDILLELVPRLPEGRLDLLALALGYQGNPRAIAPLTSLRGRTTNPQLIRAIDAALRLLE